MATISTMSVPGLEISQRDDRAPKMGYGGQIWVHVTGDSTGGAFGMWEGLLPPGGGSPIHIHHNEVECIYVIEGTFLFLCGDQTWEAGPGTWVSMPKDVQHGIRVVSDTPGRFLEFFLPAGLEQLFNKLPEQKTTTTPDMAKILDVAQAFGLEFIGPMPTSADQ
ncbi:MAG: cupin domain-containing protein [Thermomicrobiales bacterium]|nr:cupin domain-containing protein [Thermomicrobiales bacterium]MCO5223493.1 cupin domain-containing protein [Thermomicrobiales bacterium]